MSIVSSDNEGIQRLASINKSPKLDNMAQASHSEALESKDASNQVTENLSADVIQADLDQEFQEKQLDTELSEQASAQSNAAQTTQEALEEAVDTLNKYMESLQRDLEFNIDDDSGRTIIKVIDKSTNEVVRVLPPEEATQLARSVGTSAGDPGAIIDLNT